MKKGIFLGIAGVGVVAVAGYMGYTYYSNPATAATATTATTPSSQFVNPVRGGSRRKRRGQNKKTKRS